MGYYKYIPRDTSGGWAKHEYLSSRAVGAVDHCCVLHSGREYPYRMWFSWLPVKGIAFAASRDGIHWSLPKMSLPRQLSLSWCDMEISQPCVIFRQDRYHLWFTGKGLHQSLGSVIGYGLSDDGIHWSLREEPVLQGSLAWECQWISSPTVIWDAERQIYKIWYTGGDPQGTTSIGYGESPDGIYWYRPISNHVFAPDHTIFWEAIGTWSGSVLFQENRYYLFYTGIGADWSTTINLARSEDGVTRWERHPQNPLLAGTDGQWDYHGVTSPSILRDTDGFQLWYTGWNQSGEYGNDHSDLSFATLQGKALWPAEEGSSSRDLPEQPVVLRPYWLGCCKEGRI